MNLCVTPFHARAAAANRTNVWETRNGFTLAADYGDVWEEALAARFAAVMVDLSWQPRARIGGPNAAAFVSRLFTRDVSMLMPGTAADTLWLNDAGGVRGLATVLRHGEETFETFSTTADIAWFATAAPLFGASAVDCTAEHGVLAVIGPMSAKILASAGLDPTLAPMSFRRGYWRGLDVTVARLGLGYALWCAAEDGPILWDRLAAAGKAFALRPAGQRAFDILALESGMVRDFAPAGDDITPTPHDLGLADLVETGHPFNGRAPFKRAVAGRRLAGVLFDGEAPQPNGVMPGGRALGSLYSPALRRAIALAVVEEGIADGAAVSVGGVPGQVIALPFLPIPAPILPATENPSPPV